MKGKDNHMHPYLLYLVVASANDPKYTGRYAIWLGMWLDFEAVGA